MMLSNKITHSSGHLIIANADYLIHSFNFLKALAYGFSQISNEKNLQENLNQGYNLLQHFEKNCVTTIIDIRLVTFLKVT